MTTSFSNLASPKATNVILHAFDWPYQRIAENAKAIAEAGFKAVLVSPPIKSLKSEHGTEWWQRYQPQDYRVIDNQLGNTVDFIDMTNKLMSCDVDIYVDVVFNHMANETYLRSDLNYPSKVVQNDYLAAKEYFDEIKLFGDLSRQIFTEQDFVKAFPIQDWTDPWQVQHGRISGGQDDPGLPTLKCNDNVVKQQQSYLLALKKLGIKGFRIDAAKHLTLEHIQRVWNENVSEGVHIFGEIITNGGASKEEYDLFLEPYLKDTKLGAYDFPLFHSIYNSLEKGAPMTDLVNPYSVGQALAFDRAITFAITHDIPNNDVFLNQIMSEDKERLAYCYLLGRDGGVPLIYSDLDSSGIKNTEGKPRWYDAWRDSTLIKMIKFHNLMQGEPMHRIVATTDHLTFCRGNKGIVAINKSESTVSIDLPEGIYQEILGLPEVTLSTTNTSNLQGDGKQTLTLASMSCAMLEKR
ncbi:alpha-amylase family glycosyl hydrolase [Photobacterium minamisatsumaniensis]|uniref:alpha-amylase family glycosyl hydrolase n=1 Tax=Photobacterium minamisatsumaniensis TaxID=2910233 RepID=UPI003D0D880C